jgi:cell division protein FtsI/penicillin-binding protein 2
MDLRVQQIVEEELAEVMVKHSPISASAMVIRPRTGEILALATLPNFDSNRPGDAKPEYRRNRIICDVAEPGSTFKIVVVAGALNDGIVRLTDMFDCEHGKFFYAGRTLHDAHGGYGVLNVQAIVAKSSNIGASKIGIKRGSGRLYDYIRGFGFGQRTGIPLAGELSGIVHPLKKWTKVSITSIPMGQEIAVTPLQMVMGMCAIANDGWLMRPILVNRLVDETGEVVFQAEPEKIRQIITEATAKQMITALKSVVSAEGTAAKAKLDYYTVAGKTGTAQKAVPGGYSHEKFFSSFIGFFPADSPELCISVVLDEPSGGYYGGQSAAPVFKSIAERVASHLKIRPDIQPVTKTESMAEAPPAEARRIVNGRAL